MYFKTLIILAILGTVFGRIKFHFGTYVIVDPGYYPGMRKVHRYLQKYEFPDIPVNTSTNKYSTSLGILGDPNIQVNEDYPYSPDISPNSFSEPEILTDPNANTKKHYKEIPDMPPNSFSADEILADPNPNTKDDYNKIPVNISRNNKSIIWQWLGEKEGWQKIMVNGNPDWQLVPNGNTSPNTDFPASRQRFLHDWDAKNIKENSELTGNISPNVDFGELELLRNPNARTNFILPKRQRDDHTWRVEEFPGNEEMFENRSLRDQIPKRVYRRGHRHPELWSGI